MSRSYRKPYAACTGKNSAKEDKRHAARGMRRKQNQWLRNLKEFDDSLVPHRLECANNDVWGWGRDGHQYLQVLDDHDWSRYCLDLLCDCRWRRSVWPPTWAVEMLRK